jgi:hypothetical protein
VRPYLRLLTQKINPRHDDYFSIGSHFLTSIKYVGNKFHFGDVEFFAEIHRNKFFQFQIIQIMYVLLEHVDGKFESIHSD